MTTVKAYAAPAAGAPLEPFEYTLPEIGPKDIDIAVVSSGVCHSDLSMIDNEWGFSAYPLVGGHEVIGRVAAVGSAVASVAEGDLVGVAENRGGQPGVAQQHFHSARSTLDAPLHRHHRGIVQPRLAHLVMEAADACLIGGPWDVRVVSGLDHRDVAVPDVEQVPDGLAGGELVVDTDPRPVPVGVMTSDENGRYVELIDASTFAGRQRQ